MSTDKGYIKVFRDMRDHWIYNDKPFDRTHAWIDILMMVNHEDKIIIFDGHPVKVRRGMCVTSLHKLAERWGWSTGKVSRYIDDLCIEQMLRQERNTRRTIISVVNYDTYQGSRNTERNTRETLTKHSRNARETKQYTKEYTIEDTIEEKDPSVSFDEGSDIDSGWYVP